VLDFVAAMEKCSVRDAALRLTEWFSIPMPDQDSKQARAAEKKSEPDSPASTEVGESTLVNQPLKFQLKNIDHAHPYFTAHGIKKETAEQFGVGLFSGKGSIAAGSSFPFTTPQISRALFYNLHCLLESKPQHVVIVEGFFDCMQVCQAGFSCVALMGSSLSGQQEKLLVQNFPAAVLLLDGDEAGRAGTEECIRRLVGQVFVKTIGLPEGKQPDMLSTEELELLLKKITVGMKGKETDEADRSS
jgi:DNA primase